MEETLNNGGNVQRCQGGVDDTDSSDLVGDYGPVFKL